MTVRNEAEVPDKDTRYMKRVFSTENFYATGKHRFEFFMCKAGTRNKDRVTYHKLWFENALWFLSMKQKAVIRTKSDRCMTNREEDCEPCKFSRDE